MEAKEVQFSRLQDLEPVSGSTSHCWPPVHSNSPVGSPLSNISSPPSLQGPQHKHFIGFLEYKKLSNKLVALDKFEKGGNRMFDGGAYDKYQIILGETEARAVQARRGETIATPNVKNRFSDSETFEKTYFPPDQFKEGKMVKPPSFFGLSLDDLIS